VQRTENIPVRCTSPKGLELNFYKYFAPLGPLNFDAFALGGAGVVGLDIFTQPGGNGFSLRCGENTQPGPFGKHGS